MASFKACFLQCFHSCSHQSFSSFFLNKSFGFAFFTVHQSPAPCLVTLTIEVAAGRIATAACPKQLVATEAYRSPASAAMQILARASHNLKLAVERIPRPASVVHSPAQATPSPELATIRLPELA